MAQDQIEERHKAAALEQKKSPHAREECGDRRKMRSAGRSSGLYVNLHGLRMDSICDNHELIVPDWNRVRHVEMGVNNFLSGGNGHGGMVVGAAEEDLIAVLEADKGIVGGHLRVIAISVGLREAI